MTTLPVVTGVSDELESDGSQVLQVTGHDAIFEVEIPAAELPLFLETMQKSLICRVALGGETVVLPALEVNDINLAHRGTATELLVFTAEIGSLVLRLSDETLSALKHKIAGAMLRRSWVRFRSRLTSSTSRRKPLTKPQSSKFQPYDAGGASAVNPLMATSTTGSRRRAEEAYPKLSHKPPMKEPRTKKEGIVVVIYDDASCRAPLKELFESVGLEVKLYASVNVFLEDGIPDTTSCLVLDVRLPEKSGLEIQEQLRRAGIYMPIVFVTGHGDIPMAVRAMKAGAVDFLTKPFRSQDLLDVVFTALERDRARRIEQQLHSTLQKSFESLSAREREVIARVAAGDLNRQIAAELGLSEVTVKVHRAHAMQKMRAKSLPELVRMIEHCNN